MASSGDVPFTKMQAVGNDFVVVEAGHWPAGSDWSRQAVRLSDRKFGVGGDGLLVVAPSEVADVRMRMFNPDGTEDMCGNGLRCVIRLGFDRGLVGATGTVETLSGIRAFAVLPDGSITTEMGVPSFLADDIPFRRDGTATDLRDYQTELPPPDGAAALLPPLALSGVVNTGSTHTVAFVDELPDDAVFHLWSPYVEHHPWFPERTSLMWAKVDAPDALRLRIWERGAGETLGCGTGAAAAAVVARLRGKVSPDGPVTVRSKGGELRVDWAGGDDSPVYLTGRAEHVFAGEIDAEG